MTAQILDGKAYAATLRVAISAKIVAKTAQGLATPAIAVILVGEDPASEIYVRNKREACAEVGICSQFHHLPTTVSEQEVIGLIHALNHDTTIHAILIQLPLPKHIRSDAVVESISPDKDVDGFHPYNMGRLAQSRPAIRACTPFGIMQLLSTIPVKYPGKHAVIVGASSIVGRPMALELLSVGCTITICHQLTENLQKHVADADIVVSAVGKPQLIPGAWIKPGAILIDVGINRLPNGKLVGDIDFETAKEHAGWITPVPGGVGPMTVAALLQNTIKLAYD
jgi:methylenetetrahydrofolate dehydrogenase (NADP+)/methenyltetrahydrofolate cyclohydrolase